MKLKEIETGRQQWKNRIGFTSFTDSTDFTKINERFFGLFLLYLLNTKFKNRVTLLRFFYYKSIIIFICPYSLFYNKLKYHYPYS